MKHAPHCRYRPNILGLDPRCPACWALVKSFGVEPYNFEWHHPKSQMTAEELARVKAEAGFTTETV